MYERSDTASVETRKKVKAALREMSAPEKGQFEMELPFLINEITPEVQRLIDIAIVDESYDIITQGYFKQDGRNLRIRETWSPKQGVTYVLTDKKTIDEGIMLEHQISILDEQELKVIWNFTSGVKVRKVRFKIPYRVNGKNYTIELDVYLRKNQGLVRAEVEFKENSIQEGKVAMKEFDEHKPLWFGRSLEGITRMKNSRLAEGGLPEKMLKKLDWKPLPLPLGIAAILQKRASSGAPMLDTKI